MKQNKQAFTLVELIVVITILAILGTIAFISLQGYSKTSRDSVRISDMSGMKTSLELFNLNAGKYPQTTGGVEITYSGSEAWTQGTFGDDTVKNVEKLNKIPKDPLTEKEYTYSVTNTRQEYQIAQILEGDDYVFSPITKPPLTPPYQGGGLATLVAQTQAGEKLAILRIIGNYNGEILKVNKGNTTYVLAVPSIITSTGGTLTDIITNKHLAYNGYKNLPFGYNNSSYNTLGDSGIILVNSGNLVVFSGSMSDLTNPDDSTARRALIVNLQKAYSGTTIATKGGIKELVDVDISNTGAVNLLASSKVNNNLGGELKLVSAVSQVDQTDYTQYFQTGSYYTQTWDANICNPDLMTIEYISPGIDTIPTNLSGNTIYKLSSGNYINTASINIANDCTGIVGEGSTFLYGNSQLTSNINITSKYNIISNIAIDGSSDGQGGGGHLANTNCIFGANFSAYATLNKLNTFNCTTGINIGTGYIPMKYAILNSNIYNNVSYGIVIFGYGHVLNNIKLYNNGGGIKIYTNYSALNNIQAFNNGGNGLYTPNAGFTYYNNIQSYNNAGIGISFYNSEGEILNNVQSYNNGSYGLYMRATFSNKNLYYYGNIDIFDIAGAGNIYSDSYTYVAGNGTDLSIDDLTLNTGNIYQDTKTFNNTYETIPSTVGWVPGTIGKQTLTFNGRETYTYGSSILQQVNSTKNLGYASFDIHYYGTGGIDYNTSKKIGEW